MPRYVQVGLKSVAIFILAYVFLLIGNSIGGLMINAGLDPRTVGVIGALLSGLVTGCLAGLMFRRHGLYLSPLFAMLPVLISWSARGARVTRITYVYRGDELVPLAQQPETIHAALITMLLVSAVAGIVSYAILNIRANRRRG